ncbi:competence damage-inducible protein A [Streptococcus pneumoniae]|nr:competence damage-inducible protein A [Streptococcus pneumoniae]
MKKFDNYIIEKPCDSNSDKLQKILIIENLVDDILQFPLRINNRLVR